MAEHPDDQLITVTLHVLNGCIAELELFDAVRGEGHPIDFSTLRLGLPTLQ